MARYGLGSMIALGLVASVASSETAEEVTVVVVDRWPAGHRGAEIGGILGWKSGGSGVSRYQHDDGSFDTITNPDYYVDEYAMRYDLPAAGTIVWLEACFELFWNSAVQDYVFDFVIYADETRTIWDESNQVYDKGSRPGEVLSGPRTVRALLPFSGRDIPQRYTCVRHSTALAVARGSVWVSVRMPGSGLLRQMRVSEANLGVDTRFVSARDPEWRKRYFYGPESVDRWYPNHQSFVPARRQAYAIRMGVVDEGNSGGFGPLSPGEYSDCHPTTTSLVFDGDYKVGLCYETARGEVGEAKGGIWASGQSGELLPEVVDPMT